VATLVTDPLAHWWVHEVQVERYVSRSAYAGDDQYEPPETVTGFYRDGTTVVTGTDGTQIVAAGRFAFPAHVRYIPPESRVTLPPLFAGDIVYVKAVAVADGGTQPTPNHQVIGVV
jgi:hypothetical protein